MLKELRIMLEYRTKRSYAALNDANILENSLVSYIKSLMQL